MTPAPARLPEFLERLSWPFSPSWRLAATMAEGAASYWGDGNDHWDGPACYRQARRLATRHGKDPEPYRLAELAAVSRYCDQVLTKGHPAGHHAYARGIAEHYAETRDPRARAAVAVLNPQGDPQRTAGAYTDPFASRELAFRLENALAAARIGLEESPLVDQLATLARGHLRIWTRPGWAIARKPFFVAVSCLALIEYLEHFTARPATWHPARVENLEAIPGEIAACLERLWSDCWIATHADWPHGSFDYQDKLATDHPSIYSEALEAIDARHFRGPKTLPPFDFTGAFVEFTTGGYADPQRYANIGHDRVSAYDARSRTFTLAENIHGYPPVPIAPGDRFTINHKMDHNAGPGPAADLNHLIAPPFAWLWATTGDPKWSKRFDAIFDGGTMAHGDPSQQKQYNQALYRAADAHEWRASPPPLPRRFTVTAPEPMRFDVTVERSGQVLARRLAD